MIFLDLTLSRGLFDLCASDVFLGLRGPCIDNDIDYAEDLKYFRRKMLLF